jgi:small-conductance mechanosensitive channel
MTEQTQADSASVEDRMASFFASEAAPEVETAAETTQTEAPPQEAAQETPAEDDGYEPLDIDGLELRLPREAKAKIDAWREGSLRQEDYTRKTQSLAELTRQATAINEALQTQRAFDEQIAPKRTELERVKHQLQQYKAVDWASLSIEQHLSVRQQMETLKDQATELEGQIKTEQSKFAESTVAKKRELLESGHRYLTQQIKGWNRDTQEAAITAARGVGFTDNEIEQVIDPRFVHIAWKAAQFDKLQSGKTAAVAAVQKAPPVVKPGASQGPGVAAEKNYREARAQLRKSGDLKDAAKLFMMRG